jgi:hypothetical protein
MFRFVLSLCLSLTRCIVIVSAIAVLCTKDWIGLGDSAILFVTFDSFIFHYQHTRVVSLSPLSILSSVIAYICGYPRGRSIDSLWDVYMMIAVVLLIVFA